MKDGKIPPELPPQDRLMTRPEATPLPSASAPHDPRTHPTDPKPVPKEGQGTDPKAADIGRAT